MTAKDGFESWVHARSESDVPPGFADRVMEALPDAVSQPAAAQPELAQGWWRAAAILLAMTVAAAVRITPMVQLFLSGQVRGVQP